MAEQYNLSYYQNNQIEQQIQPSSSSSPFGVRSGSGSGSGSPSSQQTPATATSSSPPSDLTLNASDYKALLSETDAEMRNMDDPERSRDSGMNTSLHIAASAGQLEQIDFLVGLNLGCLLHRTNSKGDLPLHVAARAGQYDAVKRLVDWADSFQSYGDRNSMLKSENNDKNTALHIALENEQGEMAKYLFEKYPTAFYHLNSQGISPLYLAVKGMFWDLVVNMLQDGERCSWNPREAGAKSVLHLAIMAQNEDIIDKLLDGNYNDIIYSVDEKGWRPLSYAAYTGFLDGVKCILRHFPNQAFKPDDEDGSFPIHMACIGGNLQIIEHLLSSSATQKMLWLLNKKGQSILHVAAQSGKAEVVKYILGHSQLETMINMKDENGYTPLHLATKGKHPKVVYILTWDTRVKLSLQSKDGSTALDIAEDYGGVPSFDERLTWLALRYAGVPRAPQIHLPNPNILNPSQDINMNGLIPNGNYIRLNTMMGNELGYVTTTNHPKERKNKYKERLNTLLIISTLVATVTFACGFTVPGGFNNDDPKGMATLDHKWAFQVFIISNTIALCSSILAVVTLIWAHLDDLRLIMLSLDLALPLLGAALAMMSIAFVAGLYVVLQDLFWLGIVVLVMGGVFLGVLLILFIPLYSPRSCIKSRVLRYVLHVPFKLMLLASENKK